MIIGERLRTIREKQGLSQNDLERRTGIRSTYISRVENGHTVPSVASLEEIAFALGIPLHELFYDSSNPPRNPSFLTANDIAENHHRESRKAGFFGSLNWLVGQPNANQSGLIRLVVSKFFRKAKRKPS